MQGLAVKEEERLGVDSLKFTQQHNEIIERCNRQQELLRDLAMEQRETM